MPSVREAEMKKTVERLRRALAFYANPKNWNQHASGSLSKKTRVGRPAGP